MSEREGLRRARALWANPVAVRILDHLYRDQPMPQADPHTIDAAFALLECYDLIQRHDCAPKLTAQGRQLMALLTSPPHH